MKTLLSLILASALFGQQSETRKIKDAPKLAEPDKKDLEIVLLRATIQHQQTLIDKQANAINIKSLEVNGLQQLYNSCQQESQTARLIAVEQSAKAALDEQTKKACKDLPNLEECKKKP